MKLIICEKPAVASDIADALGKFKKCDGYNEVGDYCITYAFGHLLEQDERDIPKNWTLGTLPIFPDKFLYVPVKDKVKQFRTIEGLLKKADELIIATDAGREGELIARLIINKAGWRNWQNTYRLWTSEALTKFVVVRELANLKPAKDFDSLYYSALARQHSDYITGINLTRLVSIKAKNTWSVGRVQTPTLNLIVSRDAERENFKTTEYYIIKCYFEKDKIQFEGKLINSSSESEGEEDHKHRISTEAIDDVLNQINENKQPTGTVTQSEVKDKSGSPPLLHSLTTLQREANTTFGFSAQKTLDIAQGLYEKQKCISYPRTDSNHLADTNDMKNMVSDILNRLEYLNLTKNIPKPGKHVFDSSKLTDHHALIPLNKYIGEDKDEKKIYQLLLRRFIGAFMDDYKYQSTTATINTAGFDFWVTGNKIISLGWKALYVEDKEKEDILPALNNLDTVNVLDIEGEQKFTTPPKALTESTLLEKMEKLGLGTPATRASIIETLIKRDFIFREKKSVVSSAKGRELINLLSGSDIISPEMTASWESQLDEIYKNNKGYSGYQNFYNEIKNFVSDQLTNIAAAEVKEIKDISSKQRQLVKELNKDKKVKLDMRNEAEVNKFISDTLQENKEGHLCLCENGKVSKTPKCYKCSCEKQIIVWNSYFEKPISWDEALQLIKGETIQLKGLKGKNGKFDTLVKLTKNGKLEFITNK